MKTVEICECCGAEFHPLDEEKKFNHLISERVLASEFYDGKNILCAECATDSVFQAMDAIERNSQ